MITEVQLIVLLIKETHEYLMQQMTLPGGILTNLHVNSLPPKYGKIKSKMTVDKCKSITESMFGTIKKLTQSFKDRIQ